jgi:hypothetical protein
LSADPALPYVVKDPWLFVYCDELDLNELHVDALILPVRDLMSAAESRVHQERIALSETSFDDGGVKQVVGLTPGGVLYSLDVVDQARILGVGFHKLVYWAVSNELPIFLLSFPRMVEDGEYLLRTLWPWLGDHCTHEAAHKAFADTATAGAIRFGPRTAANVSAAMLGRGEPDPGDLDRAALHERIAELVERNEALASAEQQLNEIRDSTFWRLNQRIQRHGWIYRSARRFAQMLAH